MTEQRYFECSNCGQAVQGWNAAHGPFGAQCCESLDYQEFTPEAVAFEQMGWNMSTYEEEMLAEIEADPVNEEGDARKKLVGFALLGAELEVQRNKHLNAAETDQEWKELMQDVGWAEMDELLGDLDAGEDLTEVTVSNIPQCQFCSAPAAYDAKTRMEPWAYLCERCFKKDGVGLGLGKGQRLVRKE